MNSKHALLVFAIALTVLLLWGSRTDAAEQDCTQQTPSLLTLMANQIDPKVAELRDASLTYLVPPLIGIAIIAMFFEHFRGRMDYQALLLRILVVLILLHNYTATNNFRDIIRNTANSLAFSITGNNNRAEAIFENLYVMLMGLDAAGYNNIAGNATAAFALLTTPAGMTMILFAITSIIVAVLSYVLDVGTSILLLVLDILGPLALPFGILTTTKDIAWGWIYRYAEVAFYRVLYSIFMVAISTCYALLAKSFSLQNLLKDDQMTQLSCMFSATILAVVIAAVSIFCLSRIPSLAAGLIEGGSVGESFNAMRDVGPERMLDPEFRKAKRFARQ
ncbi:type IV secretion system protein [bacterium]|nr:type IV secretion system protein [bacterium]